MSGEGKTFQARVTGDKVTEYEALRDALELSESELVRQALDCLLAHTDIDALQFSLEERHRKRMRALEKLKKSHNTT